MKLPKGVVKGVKDNFDVDALELKCKQQEEEIKRLRREIVMLKWQALPEDERRGALDALFVLTGKVFPPAKTEFIEKYVKQQEEWEELSGCVLF